MNQFLFGTIGVLMLAIVGVGVYDVSLQWEKLAPTTQAAQTQMAVSQAASVDTAASSSNSSTTQAPSTYTLAQVATHNSAASCYSAINGGVYDLTSWINQHPGGPQAILSLCGKDGSSAFNAQHGGQARPANELAGFKIGTLAQ